ncbi:hypothetical protein AC578_5558 [Pseudocercospora eumusae]|uniref:Carboxylic ester hydrolase n=1 Tax=Pseudocercospora eumusae TaxID=321146 RepID=A0A139GWZ3_9PEZI|nr:hypothetical protein AC578_5558 [Pseudocercospora eumusae]KXS94658.1 hypothetical protein AC578_5558 [Pseudocercospora eumusae]
MSQSSSTFREPYRLRCALGVLQGLTLHSQAEPGTALIHYFGGIPYALPPLGPYRFRQARRLPPCYRYGTEVNPGRFDAGTAVCPQPSFLREKDKSSWDENCLQLNIYIPAKPRPRKGFPVLFYIHGGFLQWGDPNMTPESLARLLSETAFNAIIVAPAYRVNALGFLTSHELQAEAQILGDPAGNQGFWDQRLALEWTSENIGYFGGDSSNITISGYSAGSHSTFQQLAHELYFVPDSRAIIKRAIMWSNSPGVQPKSISEHQEQFDELLETLNIPLSLSASEKLQQLRSTPASQLIDVQDKMKLSEFRAFSDGQFVSKDTIANINSGDFARRMKARGMKLMNGECRDEHSLYRAWRTPPPSYEATYTRLCADYPANVVSRLMHCFCGDQKALPRGMRDWQDAFGKLYANMQVHDLERGFHRALVNGGLEPGRDLLRYRFDWQTKASKEAFPPDWGVTHSTDQWIWWWGQSYDSGLTDDEKAVLKSWNQKFAAFVAGDDLEWGPGDVKEMLRLRSDGKTDIWTDDRWEEGLRVWDTVNKPSSTGLLDWIKSKL